MGSESREDAIKSDLNRDTEQGDESQSGGNGQVFPHDIEADDAAGQGRRDARDLRDGMERRWLSRLLDLVKVGAVPPKTPESFRLAAFRSNVARFTSIIPAERSTSALISSMGEIFPA